MKPNDAQLLFDFLLPQVKSQQAVARRILSAVPPDGRNYQPSEKTELPRHIALGELWFLDAVQEQLSAVSLAQEIDYLGLRHDPAVAYLNSAIRHTGDHRGQLTEYLRGNGRQGASDLCASDPMCQRHMWRAPMSLSISRRSQRGAARLLTGANSAV